MMGNRPWTYKNRPQIDLWGMGDEETCKYLCSDQELKTETSGSANIIRLI